MSISQGEEDASVYDISKRQQLNQDTKDIVSMPLDVMVALIIGCIIILLFLIVASIYVYHVRKEKRQNARIEREVEREKKRRLGIAESATTSRTIMSRGSISAPEIVSKDIFELEQSPTSELDGGEIKELWGAECAKEMHATHLSFAVAELEAVVVQKSG